MAAKDRKDCRRSKSADLSGKAGYVPLEQIAKVSYQAEDGYIERRNLMPMITVQADIRSGTANDATQKAYDATQELRDNLPFGCKIEPAGALGDSNDSVGYLLKPIPAMIFIIMTLLMFQMNSKIDAADGADSAAGPYRRVLGYADHGLGYGVRGGAGYPGCLV